MVVEMGEAVRECQGVRGERKVGGRCREGGNWQAGK